MVQNIVCKNYKMILQLNEFFLRRIGCNENGFQLELLQLLLDLLRGPLQARQHVLTRVEVIASTEVNGNVWTADRGASGGLEKK